MKVRWKMYWCAQTNRKKVNVRKRSVPLLFKPKLCMDKRVELLCVES